jgi:O-antigen/teichoic acid export membrane protein
LFYITAPLLFILILIAKPLFLVIYSERWLPCVPYFQLLCFAGLASCLQGVNIQAIAAIGKSKQMFKWTIIKRSIGILLNVGGLLMFGMKGLLIGAVLASWFSYLINASLVSKYIGYKLCRQLLDLVPTIMVSSIAAAISYFVSLQFDIGFYNNAILKVVIFMSIYLGWSLLFKPSVYKYSVSIVKSLLLKK